MTTTGHSVYNRVKEYEGYRFTKDYLIVYRNIILADNTFIMFFLVRILITERAFRGPGCTEKSFAKRKGKSR